MGRYRKKPVQVEATQWFTDGDHREVAMDSSHSARTCEHCGQVMFMHGWIDTLQGGHVVCPGDWIIEDARVSDPKKHGRFYPCKPDIFEATYEPVDEGEDAAESKP